MIKLSNRVKDVIDTMYSAEDAPLVKAHLIYECADNIPMCDKSTPAQMDRIRLSVLKVSSGDYQKLKNAVALAQKDWRDLFMAAGFGHDAEAHNKWQP
jgi:hypothetical protein